MYLLTLTAPNGDKASREQGSWLDHAREVYGAWDRKLPSDWGLKLTDTYNNKVILERKQ